MLAETPAHGVSYVIRLPRDVNVKRDMASLELVCDGFKEETTWHEQCEHVVSSDEQTAHATGRAQQCPNLDRGRVVCM